MRRIVAISLLLVLALTLVVGCGTAKQGPTAPATAQPAPAQPQRVTLKVGATPVPHAEILNFIKPELEKEGIDLQVVEFTDYVQPNLALSDKQLDANFFQHVPYLESFSADHKLNLTYTVKVHIEPMGVYSRKVKTLDEVKEGSLVGIPNDATNGGRALALLAKAGLIQLKDGVGVKATPADITDNPKGLKIKELEAAQLPRSLDDLTLAVINTNFALEADLVPARDALAIESSESPYANVLAVRKGDENREALVKLSKALTSPAVKKFIEEQYQGAVVAAF